MTVELSVRLFVVYTHVASVFVMMMGIGKFLNYNQVYKDNIMFPIKKCIAVSLLCLSGAACQTYDAYTGEKKISSTAKFGAAGALVCGALGATRNPKSARNAALGCGLVGMGVGAYMDRQESQLRAELRNSGIHIVREGNNIRLVMPNSITFSSGQSALNSGIHQTLNAVAKVLKKFNETTLQVTGHTDSKGSHRYNQGLSVQRATSVANYLSQTGIPNTRLAILGYGEDQPVASNATEQGRAQNRRVELLIQPQAVR